MKRTIGIIVITAAVLAGIVYVSIKAGAQSPELQPASPAPQQSMQLQPAESVSVLQPAAGSTFLNEAK